jgi:hypothetical protein
MGATAAAPTSRGATFTGGGGGSPPGTTMGPTGFGGGPTAFPQMTQERVPGSFGALQRPHRMVVGGPSAEKGRPESSGAPCALPCAFGGPEIPALAFAFAGAGGGGEGYAPTPMGGVGGATRGPNLCPHSWQKTSLLGLSHPQVPQITRSEWDIARARPSSSR